MARVSLRMPDANTTTPGATAIFKLPVGMRYHELSLEFSGITLAQMSEIRLVANGKPIHRYTGVMRNVINMHDGRTDAGTTGILTIPLDRHKLKTRAAEEESAPNTGLNMPIRSLQLEIDMSANATAPVFKLTAEQSENSADYTGKVIHNLYFPRSTMGAGEAQVSDLMFGTLISQALNRVFIKPSAGTISKAQIERDGRIIFDRSAALNNAIMTEGLRTPQAGYYVIDRTERGYGGDPLVLIGANDFRYRLTCSAAAELGFQCEYIGVLGD